MRIALALGFTLMLGGTAMADASAPIGASILSAHDAAIYRQAFAAAHDGERTRALAIAGNASDPALRGYVEATALLSARRVGIHQLVDWLKQYRDLSVADRIYRLAVAHSTRRIRRHHHTIVVAVVTDIPAPVSVGLRSGGYEDAELPEPVPASGAARARMPAILADIRAGQPGQAEAVLQSLRATNSATPGDLAVLAHRIAASYLAEGMDADAFRLAGGVTSTSVPELDWDAGFAAYRLGRWADAAAHLERLATNPAAQGQARAKGAFWAARAHMQAGEPDKVVGLLAAAAKQTPSFYGLIAAHMLGIDTDRPFTDPVLTPADFNALMAMPAAHRAVALWQVDEGDYIGPELNHAFVDENPALDPAMAALARRLGVPNVELRASEKSVAQGLYLTGLFPVPRYTPEGGYKVDASLVLAFARIESRFQTGATSPAGARGLMQLMPATANHLGGPGAADQLNDPSYALSLGQRYIAELLDRLNGNLLELGGAYNAGPLSVDRWLATKAGKDDPLLFVESIPIAETRYYVKHLMAYHWLYRRRMGQTAASLDETARGQWPIYRPALPPAPARPQPAVPEARPDQTVDAVPDYS